MSALAKTRDRMRVIAFLSPWLLHRSNYVVDVAFAHQHRTQRHMQAGSTDARAESACTHVARKRALT
eukprot:13561402-Alexandrium_andersonii.AAC.1